MIMIFMAWKLHVYEDSSLYGESLGWSLQLFRDFELDKTYTSYVIRNYFKNNVIQLYTMPDGSHVYQIDTLMQLLRFPTLLANLD